MFALLLFSSLREFTFQLFLCLLIINFYIILIEQNVKNIWMEILN